MLLETVKSIKTSVLDLIYPPQCIHCNEGLTNAQSLLCDVCATMLHPLEPTHRCKYCFSEQCCERTGCCTNCTSKAKVLSGCASVFDYIGPASSIIKKMKYSDMPFLGKGVAAYMFAQFVKLEWPLPDIIVPIPLSLSHKVQRGYNQSALIASELGNYLNRDVVNILKRRNDGYSQAGLKRYQRERLSQAAFQLKENIEIIDKTVLLVDDVYTTGSTLNRSSEAICGGYPKHIYALTFCRAY
ncbi:MAG: ComF family protein [Chlamydiota bacterium]|nr:ComF family protein [Chlamydiota bacterium]